MFTWNSEYRKAWFYFFVIYYAVALLFINGIYHFISREFNSIKDIYIYAYIYIYIYIYIVNGKLHFLCSKKNWINFFTLLQLHPNDKHVNYPRLAVRLQHLWCVTHIDIVLQMIHLKSSPGFCINSTSTSF